MTHSRRQPTKYSSTRPSRHVELQRARREAGLTQAELAEQLGVRLWTVEQWESGATVIPSELLPKISVATGFQLSEGSKVQNDVSQTPPDRETPTNADGSLGDRVVDPGELDLPRALRGYDPTAVEALLRDLAATTELLQADIAASSDRVAQLEAELDESESRTAALHDDLPDLQKQETLLREALVTAHRAAHEVREEARQDSLQILRAARKRGTRILKEAERERRRIEERVAELQRDAERSRNELRDFLLTLVDRVDRRPEHDDEPSVSPIEDEPNIAEVIFEHEMSSKELIAVDADPSVAVDSGTT